MCVYVCIRMKHCSKWVFVWDSKPILLRWSLSLLVSTQKLFFFQMDWAVFNDWTQEESWAGLCEGQDICCWWSERFRYMMLTYFSSSGFADKVLNYWNIFKNWIHTALCQSTNKLYDVLSSDCDYLRQVCAFSCAHRGCRHISLRNTEIFEY